MSESEPNSYNHIPIVAIWYQLRTVTAELLVPFLAALKTYWLLIVSPVAFFRALCLGDRPLASLHSPFGLFWRSLSPEEQRPLGPAQFVLFSIFTAALAGFGFGNSNRLIGLLSDLGVLESAIDEANRRSSTLSEMIANVQAFLRSPLVVALRAFFDQDMIAALVELFATLLVTVIMAYLFYLLAGRHIPATHSYSFWLYMTGLQFLTTSGTTLIFNIADAAMLDLPRATSVLYWLSESGFKIFWYYFFPALILPRVFPALTVKRVLLAALASRAALTILASLLTTGLIALVALTGLMVG